MTTYLITCSDGSMSRSRALCARSAKNHGVDRAVEGVLEPSTERGCGFWRWKADRIQALMAGKDPFVNLRDGDILIYSDAGIEFIDNVNHIIDRMDQDIFLFGNHWDHAHWCKRDIVDEVWPPEYWQCQKCETDESGMCDEHEYNRTCWQRFGKQAQASVIFFRVSDYSKAFVKEWLDWCLFEGGRLIDDSPSRLPNHPEFRENRHDQAILTTMAYREGIKLHWWPAQYNNAAFVYGRGDYPDEGYPVLFNHHRRRNVDWEAVA